MGYHRVQAAYAVLLRDFGYDYAKNSRGHIELYRSPVRRGYQAERVGTFPSLFAAMEWLIPVIRDNEFRDRFHKISAE